MTSPLRIVLAVAAGLALAPAARANLIVNGSFESPPLTPGTFQLFGPGSTGITGWTVVGPDVSLIDTDLVISGAQLNALHGRNSVDLTGTGTVTTSGLTQTLSLTAGRTYQLSFAVGRFALSPEATVDVSIDGGPRASFTNPDFTSGATNWQVFTTSFTAAGPTTTLTFFNGSGSNNGNTTLDAVSLVPTVAAVPEPTTLTLASAAAGLLAAGRAARRRATA